MTGRRRLVLILVVTAVIAVVFVATRPSGAPSPTELAFLGKLHYTVRADGDDDWYRITSDPAVILATIPGAAAGKKEYVASDHVTTYDFYLPSGRRASLLINDKPALPSGLMIDHERTSVFGRVERKLLGY